MDRGSSGAFCRHNNNAARPGRWTSPSTMTDAARDPRALYSRQWRLRAVWPDPARHRPRQLSRPLALEALDLSIDVVLTNLVPTSPVRGACRPNVAFLLERLADRVARHLGMDRQKVRRRSFVAPTRCLRHRVKARDGSPISYDSGDYIGALDRVLDKIDATNFEAQHNETKRRQAARAGYRI